MSILQTLLSLRQLLRYMFTRCTFRGNVGNGRTRGTCQEDFLCHSDGNCKPICKLKGLQGYGKKRGSCEENELCFSDGSCRDPGMHQKNDCRKCCTYLVKYVIQLSKLMFRNIFFHRSD